LDNKSGNECQKRYKYLNEFLKKGKWTKEEDERLISLVNIFGKNWKMISKIFKTRTNRQIRIRYCELFDENLVQKNYFSKEENKLIYYSYKKSQCYDCKI